MNTATNKTSKVALNTLLQIVGKIVLTLVSLVSIGYLTRYLGVQGYGSYTTIFAYVSFWSVIADFGFFWVLVRELSKPETDKNHVFNNVITFKIFFSLVVFALATIAAFFIPAYDPSLKIGIAIICASMFFLSLNSTYVGLFQSQLEMYKAATGEILGRVITLLGVIWLVQLRASLDTILLVYILGGLANFLLSYAWGLKHIRFRLAFDLKFWKLILIESSSLAIISIIGLIHFKIDTVILSVMKGTVDVGIYGVPYKVLEIVLLLPGIFIGNVFPILTQYYHTKDERLNVSIQKSFDFLVILAVPVVVILFMLAKQIVSLIAGNAYITASTISIQGHPIGSAQVLMILAISCGVAFMITMFSGILTVIEKQRTQIVPMLIITIINVVLNVALIPHYTYFASAFITLLTESMLLVIWLRLCRKHLKFRLEYIVTLKALVAGLVMGVVLYYIVSINVVLSAIIGLAVYVVAGFGLKLFNKDMVKNILPEKVQGILNDYE